MSCSWFDRALITLDSLHVPTLALTDVQTPFLGTPLLPLQSWARRPAVRVRGGAPVLESESPTRDKRARENVADLYVIAEVKRPMRDERACTDVADVYFND